MRVRSSDDGKNNGNNVYTFVMHSKFMRRALELAETAKGQTFPNPMVGCVIVAEDKIVGEGYHPAAGQPHAEVFALRAAGMICRLFLGNKVCVMRERVRRMNQY